MPQLHSEMLPPTVNCPHCGVRMDLDDNERLVKKFECPACRKAIDLNEPVALTVVPATISDDSLRIQESSSEESTKKECDQPPSTGFPQKTMVKMSAAAGIILWIVAVVYVIVNRASIFTDSSASNRFPPDQALIGATQFNADQAQVHGKRSVLDIKVGQSYSEVLEIIKADDLGKDAQLVELETIIRVVRNSTNTLMEFLFTENKLKSICNIIHTPNVAPEEQLASWYRYSVEFGHTPQPITIDGHRGYQIGHVYVYMAFSEWYGAECLWLDMRPPADNP